MGLHMRNIVEHQSTDRDVLEIVEARRRGSGPAECLAQLVVVGVIGQRDVGEEAAGLVLQGPERERWSARSAMVSTCPYSIVQFEGRPSRWASRCTDSHSSPVSFLSAMVARAAGLNTSAPPPGRLVTPASFRAIRTSLTDSCSMRARCAIATAVRALMCTVGWRALRPRNMST